jgi:hypothetical protein
MNACMINVALQVPRSRLAVTTALSACLLITMTEPRAVGQEIAPHCCLAHASRLAAYEPIPTFEVAWNAPFAETDHSLRTLPRAEARRDGKSWLVFAIGAAAGGAAGAAGLASVCRASASESSQCTVYGVLGGALGATMGGFLAWAIADIVRGD